MTTIPRLGAREAEMLSLLAEGLSNTAIAERMTITEHSVKQVLLRIYTKLELPEGREANRRVLAANWWNGQR